LPRSKLKTLPIRTAVLHLQHKHICLTTVLSLHLSLRLRPCKNRCFSSSHLFCSTSRWRRQCNQLLIRDLLWLRKKTIRTVKKSSYRKMYSRLRLRSHPQATLRSTVLLPKHVIATTTTVARSMYGHSLQYHLINVQVCVLFQLEEGMYLLCHVVPCKSSSKF
jgi:hypothetical protein